MRRFKQWSDSILVEDLNNLQYNEANEKGFVLGLLSDIDDSILSIATEIALDNRTGYSNGSKLGISQMLDGDARGKFSSLALEIIDKHPDLERKKLPAGRIGKDYAFKHVDMKRYIYVNCRPNGKRSKAGDDPNELMTAALCLKPNLKIPKNSDEMDKLIDEVKLGLGAVKGYKKGQVDAMEKDYSNLCSAVSAAITCHKAGYGGADGERAGVYASDRRREEPESQYVRTYVRT